MLNSTKNAIFEAIKAAGFDPNQFEPSEFRTVGDPELEGFSLQLKNSPLDFEIRVSPANYREFECCGSIIAPGWIKGRIWPPIGHMPIEDILGQLRMWLRDVVTVYLKERDIPDLWATAQTESDLLVASLDDPQGADMFSSDEKALLRMSINKLRSDVIAEFQPNKEQLKEINNRLAYLSDSLDRLNRFDWKSILLSTAIGIVTSLSLDTQRGAQLLQLLKNAFSVTLHLLH